MENQQVRCVNIDWLEVYAMEDSRRYPCNADYFRSHGYSVKEREYGTRVYAEMFTIEDKYGYPWIEIRRNPMSGDSSFTGLTETSCHIRMVNRYCYQDNPVRELAEFMVLHDYTFKSLYRIDVCYDFRRFDTGDDPAKFLMRYIEKKFSKVNQTKVRAIGDDNWGAFAWESLSWGAKKSMVSTKIYNKTKELSATGNKKPWIVQAWFACHLIDDVKNLPTVWRLEFSLTSSIRGYIVIDAWTGHRIKKQRAPHTLQMFDGREELWKRFEELAYHYFHFRYVQYKQLPNSEGEKELLRKDLCEDKRLFNFNLNREFYKIESPSRESKPSFLDEQLRRNLVKYLDTHYQPEIRQACQILLQHISTQELRRYTKHGSYPEIEELQLAIATRTGWELDKVREVANYTLNLIKEKEIW